MARAKVSANRVATVVANEWKDSSDKVMPVKQWLEERRFFQACYNFNATSSFLHAIPLICTNSHFVSLSQVASLTQEVGIMAIEWGLGASCWMRQLHGPSNYQLTCGPDASSAQKESMNWIFFSLNRSKSI